MYTYGKKPYKQGVTSSDFKFPVKQQLTFRVVWWWKIAKTKKVAAQNSRRERETFSVPILRKPLINYYYFLISI